MIGWLRRHVDAKGLRDAYEIRRVLKKHIVPEWGGEELEIPFGAVTCLQLLDQVEDKVRRSHCRQAVVGITSRGFAASMKRGMKIIRHQS